MDIVIIFTTQGFVKAVSHDKSFFHTLVPLKSLNKVRSRQKTNAKKRSQSVSATVTARRFSDVGVRHQLRAEIKLTSGLQMRRYTGRVIPP